MTPQEALALAKKLWMSDESVMAWRGGILITDRCIMVAYPGDGAGLPSAPSGATSWWPSPAPHLFYDVGIKLPKPEMEVLSCVECAGVGTRPEEERCSKCGERGEEKCCRCNGTGAHLVGRNDRFDLGPTMISRYYLWVASQLGYTHANPDRWHPRAKPMFLSCGPDPSPAPAWVMPISFTGMVD